ncbi:anaerobic ribonucleoside-triphosphate reductase activating protein [Desulfofundulus luciae]|uniref:Anaerobic ribonucleoside-triphosphate reductase-activating protein n=1 Tax=Desulfofundulus luciae TaxID=74702 RepID=A0ABU0B3H2_9FIRM|nr:anaerobic ribonucleoside-triphosphate reductase activating protein [Desulfofundulus luciae]MDQ0286822.1 anaerobic ribonucleoside-triphosphate reductase activating protein [Desulfofundulus luciae]
MSKVTYVDGVKVVYSPGVSEEEARTLVQEEIARFSQAGKRLSKVEIDIDGEDYVIKSWEVSPIRRIRRITGYLAETDSWNSAKLAELRDRVIHHNLAALGRLAARETGIKLRLNGLVYESVVDGPGLRDVLFVQGCPHRCAGCQNPGSWDFDGGTLVDVADVLASLPSSPLITGVTFSGGEPFCQASTLVEVARQVRSRGLDLWVYTGYTWEELLAHPDPAVKRLLVLADVVIDGRFVQAEADLSLPFRGSRNQRLIDVRKSFETGKVVLWEQKSCAAEIPPRRVAV